FTTQGFTSPWFDSGQMKPQTKMDKEIEEILEKNANT
ncbi:unnamed protein product, partial [marine sediment metagenome]